ncbi:MAG: exonuclease [Deltaproteobacteria bacterium SG8_13]|nr:MAG: exonuclease [Deltaproteobacteria bacterium SG8_13]
MHVTFYGAAREVTGSMHLLTTDTDRILFDCGMFQGRRRESEAKNRILPFDPKIVTNVILSHAHIDHSGRIPLLVKNGFAGRVFCTRPTAAACKYLLLDSANIQESDAAYLNYKTLRSTFSQMKPSARKKFGGGGQMTAVKKLLKKNRHHLDTDTIDNLIDRLQLHRIEPLYNTADAQQALTHFDGFPYRYTVTVGRDAEGCLYDAGHILGSAVSMLRVRENGQMKTVCYTGDIGRFDKPILRDPTLEFEEAHRQVDLLIMESTYGNRDHEPVVDLKPRLREVLIDAVQRGGCVLIPSFAFGRTQELLYVLHELYDDRQIPKLPVYVDSPLASNLTHVFGEHPEVYDTDTQETFLQSGKNPFAFDKLRFVSSVEESIALNRSKKPHIVLAASGMCEAGRVLHHLRHRIHDPRNTILIVGFMAENTLGRRILEKGIEYEKNGRSGAAPYLKFLNKEYPLKAHVVSIGGFSAHGDRSELVRFVKGSNVRINKVAVVHGEKEQAQAFADTLRKEGISAVVPQQGEAVAV